MEILNNYKEIEYKYSSNNIGLEDFHKLAKSLNPIKFKEVSSWDHYFVNKDNKFIRFRDSKNESELTIKEKTTDINNKERVEVNLLLRLNSEETVNALVNLLGYNRNFKIFKSCWIYFYNKVDLVFYCVYDKNMNELGRFLEIEVLEEKNLTKEESFSILREYEKYLSVLGITAQHRLKKSIFEMYKYEK